MADAIELPTPLGLLRYRDTVFIDSVNSDGYRYTFTGEIHGGHTTANTTGLEWVPFALTFAGVQSLFTYMVDAEPGWFGTQQGVGCFYEVTDSEYLSRMPLEKRGAVHHYQLHTYDVVFNLLAEGYDFAVETEAGENG